VKGKPMVGYVVDNLTAAKIKNIIAVVGYMKEKVIDYLDGRVAYVYQEELLGTGHAVLMAKNQVYKKYEKVLITYGDMPLIKSETFRGLIDKFEQDKPTIAMLTAITEDPDQYGFSRIVRDDQERVVESVEQKDCNEEQLKIKEINPCIYLCNTKWLFSNLPKIKNNNSQGEYYLPDIVKLAFREGKKISSYRIDDWRQILGINNPDNLTEVEKFLN
jgi:bifunctional UDP-N-acetylglucosamine pyrophosphorylase/glucosamine-1-phosphate N-acetyltransferase